MSLKQVSTTAAISLVAGLTTATVGLTGSAARADSAAALPLSHYSHMLVDAAHRHIFFSQGAGSTNIVVTDLAGTPVAAIEGERGATGLALSGDGATLYAALADGDAVAAIDTATLTESTRYPTGTGSAPASVAVAGGKVWYGYEADGSGGIGSVDPSATDPAATPQPSMSHWSTAPLLATGGGVLAAEEPQQSLSHVATFDVSSGTASAKADTLVHGGTATGFQVTGDGATVLLAAPQQLAAHAYRTADLAAAAPSGYFTGAAGPNAAALDADGTIVVGTPSGSAPGVYVYAASGTLAENHITFPTGTLVPDGLRWGADGLALYGVTQDSSGAYTLNMLSTAKLTDTQLTLTAPRYAVPTQQYTFTGSLSTKGLIPVGASLTVTRDGTALPDATVGTDGSFTVSDTSEDEGAHAYRVTYAGDATHRAATASLTVHVARLSTTIPFPDFASVSPGSVVFTGSLMSELNFGSLPQGTTVQVSRTDEDTQETTQLPPVTVDPATTEFTVTDAPHSAGRFTYRLSYAGDATHQPTSSDATVQISPHAPAVTLNGPETAPRDKALTFGGKLSDTPYGSGEKATVTRTDATHTTKPVTWTAPVGTDGTITVKDTPTVGGAATYTVSYPGDASHQPATASAIVQVSRTATALSVTTKASSYAYGASAAVTAHLGTTYDGRTVSLYAQPYGGAKKLVKTGTVDASGNLSATYKLTRNTTFTASFGGDDHYAPATATHTAYGQVKITESLGGSYTSTKYGTTAYRVYHHTAKPRVTAVVSPNKSGQCEKFQAQQYRGGTWHTLTTSGCYSLDPKSTGATWLTLTNAVNQKFRVRSEYVPSAKDNTNLTTWSGCLYFTVRT